MAPQRRAWNRYTDSEPQPSLSVSNARVFGAQEDPQQNLPLRAALHCILASFRALEGPGRELQIDDAAFVSALYRRLPEILLPGTGGGVSEGETVPYVNLVYDCLEATMGKRRELSTARVVAMVKRLLSVALQLPQVGATAPIHLQACFGF